MGRVGLILLLTAVVLISGCPEERTESVFILAADGLGAEYMDFFEGDSPRALDGSTLEKAETPFLNSLREKAIYSKLKTRFPETTASHSVFYIAGDCGKEGDAIKNCVDNAGTVSLCDLARQNGHLCLMVSQGGDFKGARSEFDVAFFDSGKWDFFVERNSQSAEALAVEKFLKEKAVDGRGLEGGSLEEYSAFALGTGKGLVEFMEKEMPEKKFVVFSNAKGVDLCGHQGGAERYIECIEAFDRDINGLAASAMNAGIVFALTADHGMAFECAGCKGAHSREPHNGTMEAMVVPLIVLGAGNGEMEGMDSSMLVPFVFSLAGFSGPCEKMRYCSGGFAG